MIEQAIAEEAFSLEEESSSAGATEAAVDVAADPEEAFTAEVVSGTAVAFSSEVASDIAEAFDFGEVSDIMDSFDLGQASEAVEASATEESVDL